MSTIRAESERICVNMRLIRKPSSLRTYQAKASVGDLLDCRDEGSDRWSGCCPHPGDGGSWRRKG